MKEDSKKKKNIFLLLLKRVKLSNLIILAVLLVANSYASLSSNNVDTISIEIINATKVNKI